MPRTRKDDTRSDNAEGGCPKPACQDATEKRSPSTIQAECGDQEAELDIRGFHLSLEP